MIDDATAGPVEEADPERAHSHQRDHHRRPGEDHGATGRVQGDADRRVDVAAVRAVRLAVPRDDEERVVDADAEPDHERELAREVRHRERDGYRAR